MPAPQERLRTEASPGVVSISDRLALTGRALADFEEVAQFVDLSDYRRVELGVAMAQSGLDIDPFVAYFTKQVDRAPDKDSSPAWTTIATLEAERGNFDAAYAAVDVIAEPIDPLKFYEQVARARSRFGQTTELEIQRSYDLLQRLERRRRYPSSGADFLRLAAVAYETTGLQSDELLLAARNRIDVHIGKKHSTSDQTLFYEELGHSYTRLGMIKEALALVDEMDDSGADYVTPTKVRLLRVISGGQIRQGHFEDALQVAGRLPDLVDSYSGPHMTGGQAPRDRVVSHALLGQVQVLAGHTEAGSASFMRAVDLVEQAGRIYEEASGSRVQPPASDKAIAYLEIAKAQHGAGIYAAPMFEQARQALDVIPDDHYIVSADKLMGYEDLATAQAESGFFDGARITLDRLKGYGDFYGNNDYAEVAIVVAREEMKAGMNPEEVRSLSADQIEIIRLSNNAQAIRVLDYFEV